MSWQEIAFEDLYAEASRNGVYKPKEFHGSGIRIVNMGELFGYDRIADQLMNLIQLTELEMEKSSVCHGDLLFGRRSLIEEGAGKCSLVFKPSQPMTFESSIIRVRLNQELADPQFYFYYFKSPVGRARVMAIVNGVTVKGIRGSELKRIFVHHPPLKEQVKIRQVLSIYDDLIDANKRRIQLLEGAARLLYSEWFVKLRFPRHELVRMTNGVPVGWEPKPVSDMVDSNPKTPFPKDVIRPYVGMEALSTDSMLIEVSDARQITGGAKFRNGDTLFARITPCLENGKTGFVQFLEDECAAASGSTEFIVLRSREVNAYWVYCLARSESFREHAIRSMAGSDGRQRVNAKSFDQYVTLQPPQEVLQQFENTVRPMFIQIQSLTDYNRRLREARDLLLPKLMSGTMDVSRITLPKEDDGGREDAA